LTLTNVSGTPRTVPFVPMTVADRISRSNERLRPAERRVAAALLDDPAAVAFGTVAGLARRAGTSGPSVLRLAGKLGFEGFVDLQSAVQDELAGQLRPAAERIRAHGSARPLARALELEVANVRDTLDGVDPDAFGRAVDVLSDRKRAVHLLAGEASAGVIAIVAGELDLVRDGVAVLGGSHAAVARQLARVRAGDVVLAVELRRYERWVLDAAAGAVAAGAVLVAVTDSPLSPLADGADAVFVASAAGAGPFDSHVGTLALGNALVAGVAARLRATATARIDAVESAWSKAGALVDR
jgi:DNA-binding MurR/RpiR family transcriptional regulator